MGKKRKEMDQVMESTDVLDELDAAVIGHNSGEPEPFDALEADMAVAEAHIPEPDPVAVVEQKVHASDQLKTIIERIERLDVERKAITEDINDIYKEAKSKGFDVKVLKKLVQERKEDPNVIEERNMLLELYRAQME